MRKIKVIICGCGKMGRIIINNLMESGVDIIGAFDHNLKVGVDVGSICGTEETGILISDINDLECSIQQNKPDICLVATKSFLKDV